jgi:hypothetical protein
VRRTILILTLAVLALAGCGHHAAQLASTSTTPSPVPVNRCPPGKSCMGCAAGGSGVYRPAPPAGVTPRALTSVPVPKWPDVSSYQGHPNWPAIAPHIAGAGVKAGEYQTDPDFSYNVAALHKLRLPIVAYWFVRPTGCAHEGAQIVAVIRSVGGMAVIRRIVFDIEIPGIQGYAACLDQIVHAALGVHGVIYTAPGTWPGGSSAGLGLWVASYGPSTAPSLFGERPLAWQFASPPFVYYLIPGLGYGDVNVDYGLLAPPPAPRVICFGSRAQGSAACRAVHAHVRAWQKGESASNGAYDARGCPSLAARRDWFARRLAASPRTRTAYRQGALRSTRRAFDGRDCPLFAQRGRYFNAQISAAKKRYGT